ncbi:MAG: Lrp/AsnC ligand binding domain-containing protein [Acidobacteria bacterium]|nr:Lrp/AsnC ligand binding domain-containing protein [Acidobacteriota bacterium]
MQTKRRPVRAYVLLNVRAGKSKIVAHALSELSGVRMVHACWGVPDVIAYVEVGSQRELDNLVMENIQKMEGVERTDTHITLD